MTSARELTTWANPNPNPNPNPNEVWYDLGARAHDLGDTREALRLYERACALNG